MSGIILSTIIGFYSLPPILVWLSSFKIFNNSIVIFFLMLLSPFIGALVGATMGRFLTQKYPARFSLISPMICFPIVGFLFDLGFSVLKIHEFYFPGLLVGLLFGFYLRRKGAQPGRLLTFFAATIIFCFSLVVAMRAEFILGIYGHLCSSGGFSSTYRNCDCDGYRLKLPRDKFLSDMPFQSVCFGDIKKEYQGFVGQSIGVQIEPSTASIAFNGDQLEINPDEKVAKGGEKYRTATTPVMIEMPVKVTVRSRGFKTQTFTFSRLRDLPQPFKAKLEKDSE